MLDIKHGSVLFWFVLGKAIFRSCKVKLLQHVVPVLSTPTLSSEDCIQSARLPRFGQASQAEKLRQLHIYVFWCRKASKGCESRITSWS